MSVCYQRHELAPGIHQDIPHEHQGVPVKTMAEERAALVAKVKAFLDKNYPCCCVAGCCGEEEEAHAIMDIMEAAGFGKLPECPSKNKVGRPCILRDRHMTQHQFDVNMRPE